MGRQGRKYRQAFRSGQCQWKGNQGQIGLATLDVFQVNLGIE